MHKITLKRELSGSILDIGGGGEGIIGRIYGRAQGALQRSGIHTDIGELGRGACLLAHV